MVEIQKPRIECIENVGDESYGKYVVEPLERGYGTTIGNSLRRILLSSLPGTAVTGIKSPSCTARGSRRSTLRLRARAKSPPATSRRTVM